MAGFLDRFGPNAGSKGNLSNLSRIGMKYDDLLIKNSQAIGYIESTFLQNMSAGGNIDAVTRATLAISDTTSALRTKSIAFFQMDYDTKRERLRDLAANGEIEFILETITDDVIVYDNDNRFCYPSDLVGEIRYRGRNKDERLKYQEKIINKYYENFEKVYNAWGFSEGISAWQYLFQWLIEGHIAFEILYDDIANPKEIIGFKELDPFSLSPSVKTDPSGKVYLEWTQMIKDRSQVRRLTDAQIIYISYSNHFRTKRISFVERLMRSFNLMRVIEHSKVIWHVMNAPIRLTTTVPVGTKSIQKSKEDVREFANMLKEDIYFNGDSGELLVEGKPNILFYKNYVLPVNDKNEQVKIEPLEYPGPNMSGSELLKYFQDKLKLDSKIPYSRWSNETGMGAYTMNAEGISREEIRYNKFISRIRSAFKELLTKPLYLQMCLDFKELKDDYRFKNAIGIQWYDDNVFEEIKNQELLNKRLATINSLKSVTDDKGQAYFSVEYLLKEYLHLSDEDLRKNESYKNKGGSKVGDQEIEVAQPGQAAAPPKPPVAKTPGSETKSEVGAKGQA